MMGWDAGWLTGCYHGADIAVMFGAEATGWQVSLQTFPQISPENLAAHCYTSPHQSWSVVFVCCKRHIFAREKYAHIFSDMTEGVGSSWVETLCYIRIKRSPFKTKHFLSDHPGFLFFFPGSGLFHTRKRHHSRKQGFIYCTHAGHQWANLHFVV